MDGQPAITSHPPLQFLNQKAGEMRLGAGVGPYVIVQIGFARSPTILRQPSAKQLIAQPDTVRVHDVGAAISGSASLSVLAAPTNS